MDAGIMWVFDVIRAILGSFFQLLSNIAFKLGL